MRTLIGVANEHHRQAFLAVLDESEFEVVGLAGTAIEILHLAQTARPELLILDHDPPALDGEAVGRKLAGSDGIPTLLVMDGNAPLTADERKILRAQQISPIRRDLMLREEAREHAQTRIGLLGARCSARRRSLTARSLKAEIAKVRASVRKPLNQWLNKLVSQPREVILVAGGRGATRNLEQVLPQIEALPVPVVIAVDDDGPYGVDLAEQLQARSPVEVRMLRGAQPLSSMSNVYIASRRGTLEVAHGIMAIKVGEKASHIRAIRSMIELRDAGLTILLSSENSESPQALGELSNAGGAVAVVDPEMCAEPTGPAEVVRWQICDHVLDGGRLTWLLQNCTLATN